MNHTDKQPSNQPPNPIIESVPAKQVSDQQALDVPHITTTMTKKSWQQAMMAYLDCRALIMLFLGFSAGMPILLIFSSLSLWLREAGVDRSVVTMFSWAALGYSFKFIWAPLIDAVPLPVLTAKMGRRRAWMLMSQIGVVLAIVLMASINPAEQSLLPMMAMAAVLLGFSSATQDIVIDAYRIESAPLNMQSVLSAMYTAGYRLGMIVAGAGALYLADSFGSTEAVYHYPAWRNTYFIMAAVMGVGILTTLLIKEPLIKEPLIKEPMLTTEPISEPINQEIRQMGQTSDYVRLVAVFVLSVMAFIMVFKLSGSLLPKVDSPLMGFLLEVVHLVLALGLALATGYALVQAKLVDKQVAFATWIEPVLDFFRRYGSQAMLLLALIGLYRISDIVAGVISNVFYQDMGFSKTDIATAVKLVGVVMVIVGGFLGGILAQKMRIMRAMMVGAILACVTNLLFVLLTLHPGELMYMYVAVIFDNLAAGLASAVFIAFLSALTSIRFTAVQYAIFSSLMTLLPKVLGGYSGAIVDNRGYLFFFIFTFAIGIPILGLIYWVDKKMDIAEVPKN